MDRKPKEIIHNWTKSVKYKKEIYCKSLRFYKITTLCAKLFGKLCITPVDWHLQ